MEREVRNLSADFTLISGTTAFFLVGIISLLSGSGWEQALIKASIGFAALGLVGWLITVTLSNWEMKGEIRSLPPPSGGFDVTLPSTPPQSESAPVEEPAAASVDTQHTEDA